MPARRKDCSGRCAEDATHSYWQRVWGVRRGLRERCSSGLFVEDAMHSFGSVSEECWSEPVSPCLGDAFRPQ